jgi:hypothetical protein
MQSDVLNEDFRQAERAGLLLLQFLWGFILLAIFARILRKSSIFKQSFASGSSAFAVAKDVLGGVSLVRLAATGLTWGLKYQTCLVGSLGVMSPAVR